MYKILITLICAVSLNAQIVDGVAIIVKGSAITLSDIKKEVELSKVNVKKATNILIRKKLEAIEIKERHIRVSSSEVYEDIKKAASRNNLNISEFYEAVRNAKGLSSTDLKVKIREKLLSQKLYASIAYSNISQPNDTQIKEYFELHKDKFVHPNSFSVVIYQAKDKQILQKQISSPMFFSPDVQTNEQILPYTRISPELASLLTQTKLHSYTAVMPDGKGGFMSFYIKDIETAEEAGVEKVKDQVVNMIMASKREQVLSDYFARLRLNAEITTIRTVE